MDEADCQAWETGPPAGPGLIVSGAVAAAALLLPVAASGAAWARGEESDESAVLVEQAVALIANSAYEDQLAERMEDALMAPHREGVDLAQVRRAKALVEQPGYGATVSRQVKGLAAARLARRQAALRTEERPARGR